MFRISVLPGSGSVVRGLGSCFPQTELAEHLEPFVSAAALLAWQEESMTQRAMEVAMA